jgi:nitrogen fixation protein NifU and related proteins
MDSEKEKDALEKLEQAILQEMINSFGPTVVDHAMNPRNAGMMENPDGQATLTGICEDTVRMQLRLCGDTMEEIRFMTNGCGATVACGSMVTEMALGKSVQDAMKIDGKRVIEAFGGLPIEHTHCADLAANALKAALKDALQNRQEPWKRMYRR